MADRTESQQKVHQATLIGLFICLAISIFVSLLALGIFSYGQLSHLESPSTAAIHDGTFPRQFGRTNKEGQLVFGIIVATLVIQAIILIAHYDNSAYQRLLIISSATTIPPYLITEEFLFQQTFADQDLGRHHPRNVRWVAGIAFAYTLLMGVSAGLKYTAAEIVVCACGLPLYHYARHQQGVTAYSRIEKVIVLLLIIMAIGGGRHVIRINQATIPATQKSLLNISKGVHKRESSWTPFFCSIKRELVVDSSPSLFKRNRIFKRLSGTSS